MSRSDSSNAAGAAAKARRRALQDCEGAIGEYDADMGARQAEYEAARAAHTDLMKNIQVCLRPGGPPVCRARRDLAQQHQQGGACLGVACLPADSRAVFLTQTKFLRLLGPMLAMYIHVSVGVHLCVSTLTLAGQHGGGNTAC